MTRSIECSYCIGDEIVLISVEDSEFLWENGYFGRSPVKEDCPNPLFGMISVLEAFHLLHRTESGDPVLTLTVHHEGTALSSMMLLELLEQQRGREMRLKILAYNALRNKGWIVHSGLNYGTDFLIYANGPDKEHAPYAVVVKCEKEGCTWREASALNRVASTAKKRLVVAFVSEEDGKGAPNNPSQGFRIKFLCISRWIPEMDRS